MSEFLSKLGLGSYRHPWRVIAAWMVVLAVLGGLAYNFAKPTDSAITIPGTEAQVAIDKAEELFPNSGGGSGRIALKTQDGSPLLEQPQAVRDLVESISKVDGVAIVVSPRELPELVSPSGNIAFLQVQLEKPANETDPAVFEKIDEQIEKVRSDNLQIEKSMSLSNMAPEDILGIGEVVGVAIAFVVLLVTLGSLVAAGMPILSALIGVGVSMAGLFAMSELITIGSTTPVLAIMLGLAVGIDYALFIVNRYQSLLRSGLSYEESIKTAIGTAGNAVVFAALTVVVALAALSVVQIPFITTMGLVGAASVAVAALASITFIPALLGLAKGNVFRARELSRVEVAQKKVIKSGEKVNKKSIWYKWVSLATKYPVQSLLACLALVALFAYPITDMKLGLPTDQYAAEDSTYKKAYDILEEGFGVGFNGPLMVVAEGIEPIDIEEVMSGQAQMPGLLPQQPTDSRPDMSMPPVEAPQPSVDATPSPDASMQDLQYPPSTLERQDEVMALMQEQMKLAPVAEVSQRMMQLDGVEQALPVAVSDDGKAGLIQVIPSHSPTSDETVQLIDELRSKEVVDTLNFDNDVKLSVTGSTALELDISEKLNDALPVYLAVVVGLSLLLLVLAFRSILVPIKATLGFLASVLVMFGSLVAVFQWGWFGIAEAPGPIVSFIPIIAIGILFGLAMDYEFFLVSSMHESYSKTKKAKKAVVNGFAISGRVVAAAAIIMVSVFAGFIGNHDSTIQAMGFGLAIGIFFDAFIVRMIMVPAVMTLIGDRAWWLPKWLDKYLPHVSIEGKQ